MTQIRSYRDLIVWQKARLLVSDVYRSTQRFPAQECYGLTKQIRGAAVSVMSNIAEGSSKRSTKEFIRFLNISYGSLAEVESQLFVAQDLDYLSEVHVESLLKKSAELGRLLNALINKLQNKLTELRTPNSELCNA